MVADPPWVVKRSGPGLLSVYRETWETFAMRRKEVPRAREAQAAQFPDVGYVRSFRRRCLTALLAPHRKVL